MEDELLSLGRLCSVYASTSPIHHPQGVPERLALLEKKPGVAGWLLVTTGMSALQGV